MLQLWSMQRSDQLREGFRKGSCLLVFYTRSSSCSRQARVVTLIYSGQHFCGGRCGQWQGTTAGLLSPHGLRRCWDDVNRRLWRREEDGPTLMWTWPDPRVWLQRRSWCGHPLGNAGICSELGNDCRLYCPLLVDTFNSLSVLACNKSWSVRTEKGGTGGKVVMSYLATYCGWGHWHRSEWTVLHYRRRSDFNLYGVCSNQLVRLIKCSQSNYQINTHTR